jgi:mannose-1-phosphate guanylyltransferase
MKNNYIAIMAGGVGTRFWPASRSNRPKQFLDILNIGKSLLQMTFDRAALIVPPENIVIVSNKKYKDLIINQIPHLRAKNNNGAFAVIPSDHMILDEKSFKEKMITAFNYASSQEAIVTLGIKPTRPDTGYGYINFQKSDTNVLDVLEFKEKPNATTAQKYLDSGDYLWNAGIFVWSIKTIINSFRKNASDILSVLSEDLNKFGTPQEQSYIDQVYPHTRNISVDFAILEQSDNVKTIPSDIGWSDLGTWDSLYNYLEKDVDQNVIQAEKSKMIECGGNLIRINNSEKLIVAKGLENFIVVDDDDVLIIYPRKSEQEIKSIRNDLPYSDLK